jgi:hypothetical protein
MASGQLPDLARIFHQGRARVGCDAVRWQGVTTLRAHARKEEQRGQRTAARLNRVCSVRTNLDLALEANKVWPHAVLRGIGKRPGEICGLGSVNPSATRRFQRCFLPSDATVTYTFFLFKSVA